MRIKRYDPIYPVTLKGTVLKMYDVLFLFFIFYFFLDAETQEVKKGIL